MPACLDAIKPKAWIAISCVREYRDIDYENDSFDSGEWWKKNKKEIIVSHPSITGEPLQVVATNFPFILVDNLNTKIRYPLDTRSYGFIILDKKYAKSLIREGARSNQSATNYIPIPTPKGKKSQANKDKGLCPICLKRLKNVRKVMRLPPMAFEGPVMVFECDECSFVGYRKSCLS